MNVLIVEDDALVALDLAEMVGELGHRVIGPFGRLARATSALLETEVHFGLLDYNLRGETSETLADLMTERRVPFAFLTGNRMDALPARFRAALHLDKPLRPMALEQVLTAAQSDLDD